MDRSTYPALVTLFRNRPRTLAISRAELRERLIELCGVDVHTREIQILVDRLATQENWCIISETRGYWRLDENASTDDIRAAEHSVNTLRAHAQAEMDKARLRESWIGMIKVVKESRERQRSHVSQQTGLFA